MLGTTVDGVRSRIRRGSVDSVKIDGTVYVLLDPDQVRLAQTRPDQPGASRDQAVAETSPGSALLEAKDETIAELRDRVAQLTKIMETRDEELRRKDHLLAATLERVPALGAPRDEPEGSEPPPATEGAQEAAQPRSWWRRWLGG
jgi:Tfp pilus assembly protein FimV